MKQKDIPLILVVVFVSAVFSLVLSKVVITPSDNKVEVEVVEPITTDFQQPDKRYFSSESINPAQLIEIQENSNQNPFN
jgi:hypothetical protein